MEDVANALALLTNPRNRLPLDYVTVTQNSPLFDSSLCPQNRPGATPVFSHWLSHLLADSQQMAEVTWGQL